jgi:protoporphyrinogen oxidase
MTRVAVVGGGILGTVLSLRLAQAGHQVTLLERGPSLGGLAGTFDFEGHRVDRFYHVVVPSDARMIALAEELGLGDALRFREVKSGFWAGGRLYPLDGATDLLRFGILPPVARLRLAWFVAMCQMRRDHAPLETVPLERWLRRQCGRRAVERIWRPLLDSRFDGRHDELPATYLWARTNRMRSARAGAGAETMGHLVGGHERLIEAAGEAAAGLGVDVRVGAPVQSLAADGARVTGVVVGGETEHFDLTIPTLQPPALSRLLPFGLHDLLDAYPRRHLGAVCLILKLRRSVVPCYAVNICEPTPITTVVETTHVLGTGHTGGLHLAYLPKYCERTAPEFSEDDRSIYDRFTAMLGRIAPDFRHEDVVAWTVQRAPVVEPVHAIGHAPRVAPVWPGVAGLALASASQIYPRLLNGDSVIRFAEDVAGQVADRVGAATPREPRLRPQHEKSRAGTVV